MTNKFLSVLLLAGVAVSFSACSKDDDAPVIPPSDGTTLTLSGGAGGANAENTVFVDFSKDEQDTVKRVAWDLGFYCSSTDFRVKINNTTAATAKMVNKTDLTQITAADTTGFAATLALGQGAGTFDIIDDVDGDITKTVIAAVSATDADNKVYILKLSNGMVSPNKDWYKIRVLRNGTGYKLQYAKLSETTVKTIDIAKDASYNFKYVALDNNAIVNIEPAKANWDIEWTLTTYKATATIPYTYSDYVYINYLGGVTAAQVMTTTSSYDAYAEANIATTTFSSSKTVIGGNWRATTGTIGVFTDRFYVVKDPAGNVYKLKFVSFHANDGGVRGKPVIEYKLVKKA